MTIGSSPWPFRCCMIRKWTYVKYILTGVCGLTFVSTVLRSGFYDPPLSPRSLSNQRDHRVSSQSGRAQPTTAMGYPSAKELEATELIPEESPFRRPVFGSPTCPRDPPGLGVGFTPISEDGENLTKFAIYSVSSASHAARRGGWWQPNHCQANRHTAIIIPYRERADNLRVLLRYLHPMLQQQLLHYRIFVAEQDGNGTYNKGRIMNSAFMIVRSLYPNYSCFVFHDVDMVPEDDRNLYICGDHPRHLSPAVDKFNYTLPYKELIGGVLAMKPEQFVRVNGYANVFWGWGGEDDDMYYRIVNKGYRISRPSMDVGRYSMLPHVKRTWISHKKTYDLLARWRSRQRVDGVSNIKYELVSVKSMPLYTHLLIRFDT